LQYPIAVTMPAPMSGITPQKPTSIWKRPLKVKFGDLAMSLGKAAISGAFGQWPAVASGGVDILSALGIQGNEVAAVAWLLVQRSLLQAMSELTQESKQALNNEPDFKRLCEQLDDALANNALSLEPNFFTQPKQLPIVAQVQAPFRQWLQAYGLSLQQAQALSERLPRYFVFALNEQWRTNAANYAALQTALSGPFESANERELAWLRYRAWLQRRVDEPMFAEAFGLRQIYVPLRAYFKTEIKPSSGTWDEGRPRSEKDFLRHVVDLQTAILGWLGQGDKEDTVRIICGGPGAGKSSFGRMLAAHLADSELLPILFVPLHQFDPSGDLVEAIERFLRDDLDSILPPNPLDKAHAEQRMLLIFDGLDELAMQGRVGTKIAQDFIREVQKKLLRFNQSEGRVFALISGRDLAIQAIATEFRQVGQVLHLLPYFQSPEERQQHAHTGEQGLLAQDQRQTWWQTYGQLKKKFYDGLPKELNQGKLVEITAQPLLNYLVALSYDRGEVDFSAESNLNAIYSDLLQRIYEQDWKDFKDPTLGSIEPGEFVRILEEIAIACWHGNGRTTTIKRIADRCASGTLKRVLEIFEGGANEGVTRLLTAFYFRQSGIQGSEATFEFTHKSFGEYLTARRLVLQLGQMQQEHARHEDDPDMGWSEKDCLKRWTLLCGPVAMNEYLLSFLQDEIKLHPQEQVAQWQALLCKLIAAMLRHGMPLEEITPRPRFIEETRQARNASETLLTALSSCAWVTQTVSKIDWPTPEAFGTWLAQLQGQPSSNHNPVAFHCLNHLNLRECNLNGRNLNSARLEGANLEGASLEETSLVEARLDWVNLEGASLVEARLVEARLDWARLEGANLEGANLEGASLDWARLEGANLEGANLENARLDRASLESARLDRASLKRASLKDISWNQETSWAHVQGLETAREIPPTLQEQLGL
jgi:hypothetical protein